MANNLTGAIATAVANAGLKAYNKKLLPLEAFTRDFSPTVGGSSVDVRLVPAITAQDVTADLSGDYGAAAADVTFTKVNVALDKIPAAGFHLTDNELRQLADGAIPGTVQDLIDQSVYAVANSIVKTASALVVNANYSTAALDTTAANFDHADVTTLRGVAVAAGWDMDDGKSSLVLGSDWYSALLDESPIIDFGASQMDTIKSGKVPMLKGFRVIEHANFPYAASTAASEKACGFIARPDAMAIAMRVTGVQGDMLAYEVLQDPVTGAVLEYTAHYDPDTRKVKHVFSTVFGVSKGNASALKRITNGS